MQVVLSQAAFPMVADRLAAAYDDLDVVTLGADKIFRRGDVAVAVETLAPEVLWLSLDLYPAGLLPTMFGLMLHTPHVRWAQLFNAGLDSPVFASLMAKGIRLSKSSAQSPAIAEYVLAHGFSALHPIAEQAEAQARRAWTQIRFREIGSTRWTMFGFGSIGQAVAERLHPFGAALTVVRRSPGPHPLAERVLGQADALEALGEADVVVLACPLTKETRGLAGHAFFDAMKRGSILINIGRGGLVDEAALRESLSQDKPRLAVLDVFQTEPLPADSWIWSHPKIRVTAHASSYGDAVPARGAELFVDNLRRYRAGDPLLNEASLEEAGAATAA